MTGEFLNLGCFTETLKGYVNIDLTCEKADILCDMRDYAPKGQVVDVNCAFALGFLEDPYKMLEKICYWISSGGHLSLVVRETEAMEKYIEANEEKGFIIKNGRGLYGEGINRIYSFRRKQIERFFEERGFDFSSRISGPDIHIEAYKIVPKAKRMFFIFGVPAAGKTTLVKNLIGFSPIPDKKEIHISKDWKFSAVGLNLNKDANNGYEGIRQRKRFMLLKVASSLTENVIFEGCTPSEKELDKIETFCKRNEIEFLPYELICFKSVIEKRREKRLKSGHKSDLINYVEANVESYKKRYKNPTKITNLDFLKEL